jgi:hypothetical protein
LLHTLTRFYIKFSGHEDVQNLNWYMKIHPILILIFSHLFLNFTMS